MCQATFSKDLSTLGRDLSSVIIVDNTPDVYAGFVENAIPIKSWYNEAYDSELTKLIPLLTDLARVEDV